MCSCEQGRHVAANSCVNQPLRLKLFFCWPNATLSLTSLTLLLVLAGRQGSKERWVGFRRVSEPHATRSPRLDGWRGTKKAKLSRVDKLSRVKCGTPLGHFGWTNPPAARCETITPRYSRLARRLGLPCSVGHSSCLFCILFQDWRHWRCLAAIFFVSGLRISPRSSYSRDGKRLRLGWVTVMQWPFSSQTRHQGCV